MRRTSKATWQVRKAALTMLVTALVAAGCQDPSTAPLATDDAAASAAGSLRPALSGAATDPVSVTVTTTASESHTYFAAPHQVTIQLQAGSSTVTLTPGVPAVINIPFMRSGPYGSHPNPGAFRCASGYDETHAFSFTVTANGVSGAFTQPVRVRWICNDQGQIDAQAAGPLTLDLGDGVMLEIRQPERRSGQFRGCTEADQECFGGGGGPSTLQLLIPGPAADDVPPTIAGSVAPSAPDGANGWYLTAPTVSWTCSDAQSGIASCSAPTTLGEAATAQQVSGTAADAAGNTASAAVSGLLVDLTNPVVTCGAPQSFTIGAAGSVNASVEDGASGAAQAQISATVNTATPGQHLVSLTGTDNAGRSTTVACNYGVRYGFDGFFEPVRYDRPNALRAGQTLPLKWRVTNAAGEPVTGLFTATVTAHTAACALGSTADLAQESASGNSGLQDLGDGYYQFNWATPKSYAKSCKTATLDLGDGVMHSITVAFTR